MRGRAALMLGLFMLGCGWFDTRSPAEPSESNVPWRQPTQAHYVVENLENTLEGMDLTLYGRCIDADRFLFQADPVLAQIDPSRYENWRWAVEEGSTRRMLEAVEQHWGTADSAIVLAFTEEEWLVNEADTSMVQYRYRFTVHHGRTDVDSLAAGTLRWGFRRSAADRLWYLAGWSDFADEAGTAWSAIKGAFRQ